MSLAGGDPSHMFWMITGSEKRERPIYQRRPASDPAGHLDVLVTEGHATCHMTDGLICRDAAGWGGMKWDGWSRNRANDKASKALKGA